MTKLLLEDKRNSLLSRSKGGAEYAGDKSKGKNRYQRRLKSKLASSVKHFNELNMDKLFKADILDVIIDVVGETNNYQVKISFTGVLTETYNYIKSQHQELIDRKALLKGLTRAFNSENVYINCTCPDFRYRFAYWCTVNNTLVGEGESRAIRSNVWHWGANKDDPNGLHVANYYNDHGSGCKHTILALSDASWLIKVASVIYNYINYMEQNQERLYQKYIYPAIYQEPYADRQLSIFDDEEEVIDSTQDTIDAANKEARQRNWFKKDNPHRFKKKPDNDQLSFDELELENENEFKEIPDLEQAKLNIEEP